MLWFPFAKINLGLAVLNKRADGFHNIESLLHPIALYDILEIIENPNPDEDELSVSGLSLNILSEENLVWKAVQLLRKQYSFPFLKIQLHKQIPSGAGLGGGSSDAAFTLLAISQLFKLNIDSDTLVKLASRIGSDCPFFLHQQAQYAEGKGEILRPFKLNLNPLKLLLIIPDFTISTKVAYNKIVIKKSRKTPSEVLEQSIKNWKKDLINDFENMVFNMHPSLEILKQNLYKNGAVYTSLSGSGSGIYALFSEKISIELPKGYQSYWLDF